MKLSLTISVMDGAAGRVSSRRALALSTGIHQKHSCDVAGLNLERNLQDPSLVKGFILVRVAVDLESILGILGAGLGIHPGTIRTIVQTFRDDLPMMGEGHSVLKTGVVR